MERISQRLKDMGKEESEEAEERKDGERTSRRERKSKKVRKRKRQRVHNSSLTSRDQLRESSVTRHLHC